MGNGCAKGAGAGALDIDMNPLVVARGLGEQVDLFLNMLLLHMNR